MPFLPKVINNSFPIKMVCECETFKYFDTVIHPMPENGEYDLCHNMAYLKFDIDGEGIWLCAECLKHKMAFIQNPETYNVIHFADGSLANGSVR